MRTHSQMAPMNFWKRLIKKFKKVVFHKSNTFIEGENYNWIFPYLPNHCNQGEIILEIGSRDSLDSITLYNHFRPKQVVCFEPGFEGIQKCWGNITDMGMKNNIMLIPLAVGNTNLYLERRDFFEYTANSNMGASSLYAWHSRHHASNDSDKGLELTSNVQNKYSVLLCSLDNIDFLAHEKIFLMCIDAEGAELEILKGSLRLLKSTSYICVETGFNQPREGVDKGTANDVHQFLIENNFIKIIDNSPSIISDTHCVFDALYKNTGL